MKSILVLFMLFTAFVVGASAQKLDEAKVPAAVKYAFSKKFPHQIAKWENENGQFEAGFKQDGKAMSALFSADGNMMESEVAIKVTALPAPVQTYLNAHYKGVQVKEAAKITKADGSVNYEAEVNKKDVIFDDKGKFLKEAKD